MKDPVKHLETLCEVNETRGLKALAARHPALFRAAVQVKYAAVFRRCCYPGKFGAARVLLPFLDDDNAGQVLVAACGKDDRYVVALMLERSGWRVHAKAAIAEIVRRHNYYLLPLFDCEFSPDDFLAVFSMERLKICVHVWDRCAVKPAPVNNKVGCDRYSTDQLINAPNHDCFGMFVWMLKSFLLTTSCVYGFVFRSTLQYIPATWDDAVNTMLDAWPALITAVHTHRHLEPMWPRLEPARRWNVRRTWILAVLKTHISR